MISVLTAQMGIFIHLKSFRVNQIVFIAAREFVSPVRANPQSTGNYSAEKVAGKRGRKARKSW
jgi:hypothetical protein